MSIVQERLDALATLTLKNGSHPDPDSGLCVMEAAAWIAGEPHSDHPECVSPVLGAFMRRWNDDLDGEGRQKLKAFVPRVIGTAGDGQDEARGWLAADWLIRVHTPAWLDLAGITDAAAALRALPELRDSGSLEAARPALADAREKGAAAGDAAWAAAGDAAWAATGAAAWAAARDAAWAAARDAARDATWAAAGAAAGAATWDAARDAAWAAARDAAGDATWAAAWAAAGAATWAAARDALKPTTVELQASALDLLDRMIDPAGVPRRSVA